jgi:type IV secretion system protein VirB5
MNWKRCSVWGVVVVAFASVSSGPVRAQIPVTDVGAILQLIQQLENAREQLMTLKDQLEAAQNTLRAETGNRGMERLLSGTNRNYLPSNWNTVSAAMTPGAGGGAFGTEVQSVAASNAVLTPADLAKQSSSTRDSLMRERTSVALLQAGTRDALANSSARFAAIQQLVDAIPTTQDPKAIAELQARIGAEQAMLQAAELRAREQSVADLGSFRALPPLGLH